MLGRNQRYVWLRSEKVSNGGSKGEFLSRLLLYLALVADIDLVEKWRGWYGAESLNHGFL